MENAAKALLIIGGILLAIMTLSSLLYMAQVTSRMADEQDEKVAIRQKTAFNSEYESYNKNAMYGTDVISVVNKAIVNNEKMSASATEERYYINIKITLIDNFETTYETIEETSHGKEITDGVPPSKRALFTGNDITGKFSFPAGEYTLGEFQGENFVSHRNFIEFFSNSKTDRTIEEGTITYKMYSALTNFKRAIFRCDYSHYDEETGRINEMSFTQLNVNN